VFIERTHCTDRYQEHHLQAIIAGGITGQAAYIPTPPTNLSALHYERMYAPQYAQPQTYIRFSSTVEDCSGTPYCMDDDDEEWLDNLNASIKKSPSKTNPQCTEIQFEEVMSFFESTAALKQPFASVDNAPVLAYPEMETAFDDTIEEGSRRFAKDIYEHWKDVRARLLNHPLMPSLKFERNAETDDSDPYVCFRRREVRQARKTRGRDAQVAEKLKKLRLELEQARQLLHMTKQREMSRREQIHLDRNIFEQRAAVKEAKRNLGIKGDDQDLINQKVCLRPDCPKVWRDLLTLVACPQDQNRLDHHAHAQCWTKAASSHGWPIAGGESSIAG
jgi:enhancer of polycomb-like protein